MSLFDISNLKKEIERLENETMKDGFWNDIKNSSTILTKLKQIKNNHCLQKILLKKRFISVILKLEKHEYIITNVFRKGKKGVVLWRH